MAAATAAILIGCSSVDVVDPTPPDPVPAPRSPTAKRVTQVARPAAAPTPFPGLAADLEVVALDAATSDSILNFISTGSAIAFSSNLADDADPDAAPDLWRVTPGADPDPELVWRNPNRDHSLTALAGDLDAIAFVDIPTTGERAWTLWIVPGDGEPVLLDEHPGNPEVPSLVPSISVYWPVVVWTAFDSGPNGPVSQLLTASAPDWTPELLLERDAAVSELWLPSVQETTVAFTEVVYGPDRTTDERHAYLWRFDAPPSEPIRLDSSGLATMPQLVGLDRVVWKEADPGFNMFNWGRLIRHDVAAGTSTPMFLGTQQEYVNYPSAGSRFVAWWGSNTAEFGIYDLARGAARTVERYEPTGSEAVLRAHVHGDLLAWLYIDDPPAGETVVELRYAELPTLKQLDR
jgi:hypothetical protein